MEKGVPKLECEQKLMVCEEYMFPISYMLISFIHCPDTWKKKQLYFYMNGFISTSAAKVTIVFHELTQTVGGECKQTTLPRL